MKKNTLKDGLDAKKDAKRDAKSNFCCSDHATHVINWNDVQVEPEGYFLVEPDCILDEREILLRNRTIGLLEIWQIALLALMSIYERMQN